MARLLIAYTPNGVRVLRNVRIDETGEPLILLDKDEIKNVTVDLTAYLDDAETISSVTSTTISVTASVTLTSPTIVVRLSAATGTDDGYVSLVITLSSTEVIRQTIHVRRANKYGTEWYARDYA